MNLHGVSVQDRIGDQAQAARLVHDFFVIAGGEFALIRKEDASEQLVVVLAFVEELKLDRAA